MESFGTILRETREKKDLSIEKVVLETSISKQYVEALEKESIDVFPGHTYVVGFLRTYSDYLNLDPQYMIQLFQGKVIQESPIPEKLIVQRKKMGVSGIILISLLSLLFTAGVFSFLFFVVFAKDADDGIDTVDIIPSVAAEYTLSSIPIEKRVYEGDIIHVPLLGNPVDLKVSGTLSALSLDTPIGVQIVELGEELEIDVDGANGADIVVFLSDISKVDEKRGAEIRMLMKNGIGIDTPIGVVNESEIFSEASVKSDKKFVIVTDNRAYPFTLNVTFRGACLFRYQQDRKPSVEDYFTSGDTLIVQANNGCKIWMSNANAAKVQVIADGKYFDLEIGRPGAISVEEIRWVKEADGIYKLASWEVD